MHTNSEEWIGKGEKLLGHDWLEAAPTPSAKKVVKNRLRIDSTASLWSLQQVS